MLLATEGVTGVPAQLMTGRAAVAQVPPEQIRDWLTPVVSPIYGIVQALRLCGFVPRWDPLAGPLKEKCDMFRQLHSKTSGAPMLCGPLDRGQLWDRHENRYFAAGGHLVLVLGLDDTDAVTFHDPEGLPFARRSLCSLLDTLTDVGGLVSIEGRVATPTREEMLLSGLQRVAMLRQQYFGHPWMSGPGLRGLVAAIAGRAPMGSKREVLWAGLSARGRAATGLAELSAKVRAEPMLCISLRALALTSATALHALRRDDAKGIADAISEMARWEDELDHVFVRPLGQTEDPHLPPKWEMIDSDNR